MKTGNTALAIYIEKDGQQQGPLTLEEVNARALAGEFSGDDPAWIEAWSDWQTLRDVPGFVPAYSPPAFEQQAAPGFAEPFPPLLSADSPWTPPPDTTGRRTAALAIFFGLAAALLCGPALFLAGRLIYIYLLYNSLIGAAIGLALSYGARKGHCSSKVLLLSAGVAYSVLAYVSYNLCFYFWFLRQPEVGSVNLIDFIIARAQNHQFIGGIGLGVAGNLLVWCGEIAITGYACSRQILSYLQAQKVDDPFPAKPLPPAAVAASAFGTAVLILSLLFAVYRGMVPTISQDLLAGRQFYKDHQFTEAIARLANISKADDPEEYFFACNLIGLSHYHKMDFNKARDKFSEALEIFPSPDGHWNLGCTYFCLGDTAMAKQHLLLAFAFAKESPLWAYLMDVTDMGSKQLLAERLQTAKVESWPFPVYACFLGKLSAEDCKQAADNCAMPKDNYTRRSQVLCEYYFFMGAWSLRNGDYTAAKELLQECVNTQERHLMNFTAAQAMLQRIQVGQPVAKQPTRR